MFGEARPLSAVVQRRRWVGGDLKAWLAASHPPVQPLPLTAREIYELEVYLDDLARGFDGLRQ